MAVPRIAQQIVGFGLVGVMNTLISYGVYAVALMLGAHYLVASVLGFIVSVFHAWCWQYFVVFREGGKDDDKAWYISLAKTYLTYASTGLILSNVLLFLMLDVVHIEQLFTGLFVSDSFLAFSNARQFAEYLAPILVLFITIPLNFLLNKFWAFREMGKDGKA